MIVRFDEDDLANSLNAIPATLRAAFAAACAERLFAVFEQLPVSKLADNALVLRSILDAVWDDLQLSSTAISDFDRKIEICMEMMPKSDDRKWLVQNGAAEDELAAVIYVLRCRRNGQSQEAAWAARRVYEAIDDCLVRPARVQIRTEAIDEGVLENPLVQTELGRQIRDIKDLAQNSTTVASLRERAIREAIVFDFLE